MEKTLAATAMTAAIMVGGLTGCMTTLPAQTASGQIEGTFANVDAVCVRGFLLNATVNDRWTIVTSSDNQIVAEKESEDVAARILLSTRFSGAPKERIMMLFIPLPSDGLRVVVSQEYVSNAGTGFEKKIPVQGSQMVQDQFSLITPRLETECAKTKA